MRLFLDQDQVVADFNRAFLNCVGFWPWDYKMHVTKLLQSAGMSKHQSNNEFVMGFWMIIEMIPKFWEHVPPMKDFKKLWRHIKKYKPIVLTAVPEFHPAKHTAIMGKRLWINKYMGTNTHLLTIDLNSNDHTNMDKTIYCESNEDILIDDNLNNIQKWIEKGGRAIHHVDAKTTIKELKQIIKEIKNG